MKGMIAALAMVAATPAVAADFDWHKPATRVQIDSGLRRYAKFCHDLFGFTVRNTPPQATMVGKLNAHFLMATYPQGDVEDWAKLLMSQNFEDAEGEQIADRMADAMIAADSDPDSYAKAEALYVDTFKAYTQGKLSKCTTAAQNEFLGANYLTGTGNMDTVSGMLKGRFAEAVASLKK